MVEEYKNTIFKSSYWYAQQLLHLFVNFNVANNGTFSFITKKGKFTLIYNLTKDEKLPFVKNVLKQLTKEELEQVLKELA